ncbi:hypothetical protein Z045_24990 [Rhodococcus pyridinivorans KG-16]|uniref:Uncharacterized protein n=1 Tax=Rhodococcus pyridinivorans KG-16 TaxID=1441730 RepID=A0A0V9UDW2_9NOCA|nr:hypothetical protein Z045_24990 [Rhodococcus pyridinivorans KG-16]
MLDELDEWLGSPDGLWFGPYEQWGVFLHPYGPRFDPTRLWVNKVCGDMARVISSMSDIRLDRSLVFVRPSWDPMLIRAST